jgi:three-Cys-motif partner protein
VTRSDAWISPETHRKEADFAGLLSIHASICSAIASRSRPGDPPYLYVDLHGGPGWLVDDAGRRFHGSPLVALDTLDRHGLAYETVHFEQDPDVAARLASAVDPSVYPHSKVYPGTFEAGVSCWLQSTRPHGYRYGLVYADPIKDPMPVATFNDFAGYFPRVDLTAYVAANSHYKRTRASHGRRLEDDIAAVDKRHVLIREPETAHQWTFLLFTNWDVKVKWLSLEPLRTPLKFNDLSVFDWIVIGAQTGTNQPSGRVDAFAPDFGWVSDIYHQAREAGCRIHLKPNLGSNPGMRLTNEYPQA